MVRGERSFLSLLSLCVFYNNRALQQSCCCGFCCCWLLLPTLTPQLLLALALQNREVNALPPSHRPQAPKSCRSLAARRIERQYIQRGLGRRVEPRLQDFRSLGGLRLLLCKDAAAGPGARLPHDGHAIDPLPLAGLREEDPRLCPALLPERPRGRGRR